MYFCILYHLYTPGMESTLSLWMMYLVCSWIQFANILLSVFALEFIREIGLNSLMSLSMI
jgi:dipeptide/tripeptide permease